MENQNLRLPCPGDRSRRQENVADEQGGQQKKDSGPLGNPGFQIHHLIFFIISRMFWVYFPTISSIWVGAIYHPPARLPLRFLVGQEFHHLSTDLIAHFPESRQFLFMAAGDGRRIRETHVDSLDSPEENRTTLRRMVAKGYDEIEFLVREFVDGLGAMPGNVDSQLAHRGDRQRMNGSGLCSGREGLQFPRQVMVDQPLGHLAPGAVVGADK